MDITTACFSLGGILLTCLVIYLKIEIRQLWQLFELHSKILNIHHEVLASNHRKRDKMSGLLTKLTIEAKVSKEIASRAFNMASSSQVCVATLQTAIAKKPRGYQAEVKESVASKKISEELGGEGINDFLYAVMTDEEREKIEKTRKYFNAGI